MEAAIPGFYWDWYLWIFVNLGKGSSTICLRHCPERDDHSLHDGNDRYPNISNPLEHVFVYLKWCVLLTKASANKGSSRTGGHDPTEPFSHIESAHSSSVHSEMSESRSFVDRVLPTSNVAIRSRFGRSRRRPVHPSNLVGGLRP